MNLSRSRLLFVVTLAAAVVIPAVTSRACTTAVISGRATADGRPLLWKNRDAPARDNEVCLFTDGPFRCIAVVTAGESRSVWMGVNEAGLCIENSLSKDLKEETAKTGLGNGGFMLRVLQTCATVGDVELLLKETDDTGRSTIANFGVIDAVGGAVLFETGPKSFEKFDANDPEVAPNGYVVRSNFAFTAQEITPTVADQKIASLYSGERYLRGCRLMDEGLNQPEGLSSRYLLRRCCRDLADESCQPIPGSVNSPSLSLPEFINTKSTISRASMVSAAVFQGVKPGEDPLLATMWVILGSPSFSVAVPCWVSTERVAAELDGPKVSDLCTASLALRNSQYREDGHTLETDELPRIWPAIWQSEDDIIEEAEREIATWRTIPPSPETTTELHERLSRRAYLALYELTKTIDQEPLVAPTPSP